MNSPVNVPLFYFRFILKESISIVKSVSILLSILGCILVIVGLFTTVQIDSPSGDNVTENTQPYSIEIQQNISSTTLSPSKAATTSSIKNLILGFLICIASGVIEMCVVVFSKLMQDEIESVMILSFWVSIAGWIVSIIFMCILELDKLFFPTDAMNLLYLAGHTFATGIACVVYFVALNFGSAIICSIVMNLEIPLRLLFQYVFAVDLQPVSGNGWDILGAVTVTVATALPPIVEFIQSRRKRDLIEVEDKEKEVLLQHNRK